MKTKTNIFFIALTALLLTGCGSTIIPSLSMAMEEPEAPAAKTAKLTEAELKSWSLKDLQNDTIPGNGVDDDKNGYIDDIHGWNFLGDIVQENMEYVRIVRKLKPKYEGKTQASVSAVDSAEFALYEKANQELSKETTQTTANLSRYSGMLGRLKPAHAAMSKKLGKPEYSKQDLSSIENPEEKEKEQIAILTQMLNYSDDIPSLIKQIQGGVDYFQGRLDSHFDTSTDFRGVIGDDPDNNLNP